MTKSETERIRNTVSEAAMIFCEEVGLKCAKARVERREDIKSFAVRSGTSTATISRFEAGYPIRMDKLYDILDASGFEIIITEKRKK